MRAQKSLWLQASAAAIITAMASSAYAQDQDTQVDEIVSTGTSIRGVAATGSPSTRLDTEEMKAAGAAQASEILRTLPQVLNFGADESRSSSTGGAQDAAANSTAVRSVNLRGIGGEATLLLVNGRRMPASGVIKSIPDVDLIPSAAFSRIEVVADGASAIYGSDAVAGVVNLITQRPRDGAETTLRFGGADGTDQFVFSQTYGKTWEGGGLFFAFEDYRRSNLSGADRDFASQNRSGHASGACARAEVVLTTAFECDVRSYAAAPGNITINPTTGAACTLTATQGLTGTATCRRYQLPAGNGVGVTSASVVSGGANRYDEKAYEDLLPEQKRDNGFLTVRQELTDTIDVWYEGYYYYRSFDLRQPHASANMTVPTSNPWFVRPAGAPGTGSINVEYRFLDDANPNSDGHERNFQNAVGVGWDLPAEWRLEAYGSASEDKALQRRQSVLNNAVLTAALNSSNPATAFNPFGNATFNRTNNPQLVENIDGERFTSASSRTQDFGLKFDGPVFQLGGGPVKVAIGANYHNNKFNQQLFATNIVVAGTSKKIANGRDITAGFAEVFLPFVGPDNAMPGVQRFDVSLAARYEEYSDFGDTTNPKVGIVYGPTDNLSFRATYGTSFRAPSLIDTSGKLINYFGATLNHPTRGAFTGITFNGGNPALGPEEATTYTVGFDWDSKAIEGLRINSTYYSIDYTNRIDVPGNPITNPAFAQFISYRPGFLEGAPRADAAFDARVAAILASPDFQSAIQPVANYNAIQDGARHNLGSLLQEGVDFSIAYDFETSFGDMTLGVDLTKILTLDRITAPGLPVVDVLDQFGNPVDLRARGHVAWRSGPWAAHGFVNYVDSYINTAINLAPAGTTTPVNPEVDAWTTFDASVSYDFGDEGPTKGVRISANVQNLFDEEPPVVLNGSVSWDNQAASAIGRFISVEVSKRW